MHLLAFDSSTDVMSVAVLRSSPAGPQYWLHQGAGGAAASGSLIAAVMDLLRDADLRLHDLDAICFGSGPGSFTGLRTACSVAQGLAYGAGVPVLPVSSLLALAQSARAAHALQASQGCVSALLDARMDEVYAATYAFTGDVWTTLQAPCLLAPEQVAAWAQSAHAAHTATIALRGAVLHAPWRAWAGNVFASYGERLSAPEGVFCCDALPQAMALLQVAPALVAAGACVAPDQALPLYVRDKVAKTTGERALEKAHKAGLVHTEAVSLASSVSLAAAHAQTPRS